MGENYVKLPPGWDTKFSSDGKCYYINYLTKHIQLEDPRLTLRYKQLQNERCSTESIPMQPMHGSPYHVYPAPNNFPAMKAFHSPIPPSLQNISASPLLSSKSQLSSNLEMSPIYRPPSSSETATPPPNLRRRDTIQETSFSNQNVDVTVAKIQNMFPTASENHIRLLLKKYYNREAVVISALQVEKHPITMPITISGPFATPPAQRHSHSSGYSQMMTPPPHSRRLDLISRTGSPSGIGRFNGSITSNLGSLLYGSPRFGNGGDQIPLLRNSPKPHSSPKMKLRYMKNIFPKAEETLLLDILANSDNNVQKASETLIAMGYQKREFSNPPKLSNREEEKIRKENEQRNERIIPLRPKEFTDEEKKSLKIQLHEQYPKIAERIVLMALESVNYSEDRANEILKIVQQEENDTSAQNKKETDDKSSVRTRKEETESMKESQEILTVEKIDDDNFTSNSSIVVTISEIGQGQLQRQQPDQQQPSTSKSYGKKLASKINKIKVYEEQQQQQQQQQNLKSKQYPSKSSISTTFKQLRSYKLNRDKSECLKNSPKGSTEEEADTGSNKKTDFESILGRFATLGHNTEIANGPDDTLLLPDYVSWNGANPNNVVGHRGIINGTDSNLLIGDRYIPKGRNKDLCKGAKGMAKGSIYSQITTANIKCN